MSYTFAAVRKALTPAFLAVVAIVADYVQTGVFDRTALRLAVAGAVTAIAVFFVPNSPPSA